MKPAPGAVPERWATHRLVSIAARLDERRLNRRLARLGLTTGSLDALETAAEREPTTATDLAETLCVSRQSLGKVLSRLQSLGLLTKVAGRDGRSADIHLTSKGRDILATAENLIRDGIESGAADEGLFRRHLEQHILRLRNAEQGATTRHLGPDINAPSAPGGGHRRDRQKTHYNATGVTPWRQPTGLPEPKLPSKEQPRQ
ncbi:MarR family winged helix-turn-helix transcriptional regulator [Arthrobacter sp. 9AX]|uniref:MarR family winged helix-turn-helix transcriptional regulator n=1 Tax=Arthrobacter sp. 9AX TaxID=2653131 RepID=UPI00135C1A65|nr:MarR family transcriptional regulator [Arthrobacter sp. 9AX]